MIRQFIQKTVKTISEDASIIDAAERQDDVRQPPFRPNVPQDEKLVRLKL